MPIDRLLSSMFVMTNSIGYHVHMAMRPSARWFAFLVMLGGMTAWAPTAGANGRFPRAQALKELPTDSNRLILSATYGLLATNDRGKNWYLVCERSLFGVAPARTDEVDPLLELTPSGAILSGSIHALRVSRDGACTFATEMALPVDPSFPATGKPNDQGAVQDISLERAKGDQAALALVVRAGASPTFQIYETLDDAVTWKPLGQPIPSNMARMVVTLDVAPSNPSRIYVTAQPRAGADPDLIIVSDDGGQTWIAHAITGTEESDGSYIAAVSATNPDVVYVRTNRWMPDADTGGELAEDILLLSKDGGKTWTELLRQNGKLMGFALSPDGATVLAGYGDPVVGNGRIVDKAVLGVYRAPADATSFEKIFSASVTCLAWNATGVYACAAQPMAGFQLGFAPNANFDLTNPRPFEPLLKLPDVFGPFPWPANNNKDVCMADWLQAPNGPTSVCSDFGACRDGGVPAASAPVCGATGDGGAGATGGAAGSGGAGGGAASDGGGQAGTGGTGGDGDDCGCRVPGASRGGSRGVWALFAAAWFFARRRRAK